MTNTKQPYKFYIVTKEAGVAEIMYAACHIAQMFIFSIKKKKTTPQLLQLAIAV